MPNFREYVAKGASAIIEGPIYALRVLQCDPGAAWWFDTRDTTLTAHNYDFIGPPQVQVAPMEGPMVRPWSAISVKAGSAQPVVIQVARSIPEIVRVAQPFKTWDDVNAANTMGFEPIGGFDGLTAPQAFFAFLAANGIYALPTVGAQADSAAATGNYPALMAGYQYAASYNTPTALIPAVSSDRSLNVQGKSILIFDSTTLTHAAYDSGLVDVSNYENITISLQTNDTASVAYNILSSVDGTTSIQLLAPTITNGSGWVSISPGGGTTQNASAVSGWGTLPYSVPWLRVTMAAPAAGKTGRVVAYGR